jgi:putative aldouronate transport system substrate-binding protein
MRRIITIAVCIMTCMALVAGCTSGASTTAPAATSAAPATSSATGTAAAAATPTEEPYLAKYDQPVTVNLALRAHPANKYPAGDDPSNNVWTRAWKDDLNIVENTMWEANADAAVGSDYEMKMNIAIASRALPDIMYLSNYSQFDSLMRANLIEDLTPYYEQYASPDLKKNVMDDGGQAMSWATVSGKLMGFPVSGVNYMSARMIWIRHDWFVDSGLPVPKTMEDVLAIAKAFKDKDPANRYGIALSSRVEGDSFCDIQGISNCLGAFPTAWVDDGTGKAVYGSVQPAMKNVLTLYNQMFKDGLIDPAFASIDGNKVAEQLTGSKIGVVFGGFWLSDWPLNTLWDSTNGKADWDLYTLLPSSTISDPVKAQVSTPAGNPLVVRKGFEHPEVLFKLLNFTIAKLSNPTTAEPNKFGQDPANPDYPYGMYNPIYVQWFPPKTNIDSYKNITAAIDKNDKSLLVQPQDTQYYPVCKKYVDEAKAGTKIDGMDWAMAKYWYGADNCTFGVLDKYFQNNNYFLSKLVGYQTPTMVQLWSTMQQFEQTNFTQFISGAKPLSDWDKFVSDWNSMGGELIGYEVNNWLAEKAGK